MNSGLQFYDGITTKEIQKILVKSASDLISLDNQIINSLQVDYFYLQSKNKFLIQSGKIQKSIHLKDIIERNIDYGVYDNDILKWYKEEELEILDKYIKHSRDLTFTYAGLQQIVDKYLVQDRSSNGI